MPVRVLHFSDIHIGLGLRRIPLRDWPGKRLAGGLNLARGRGRRFEDARDKLVRLAEIARSADIVVFSGDFTAMGTDAEFEAARAAIEPILGSTGAFVCVPGNHDLYAPDVVRERRFEKHFGDLLETDRPDLRIDGPWPVIRLLGGELAVVALNSARPNRAPWRSSGRIPDVQLRALNQALHHPDIAQRFVLIVTHYAPRLWGGAPDTRTHRLVNTEAFLSTCAAVERGAILCGHVHRTFRVRIPGVGPEIFCAGSATMHELEGFWLLDVEQGRLSARRGRWTGDGYVVESSEADLPAGPGDSP